MSYSSFNMQFMRQVIAGENKILKAKLVCSITVPKFKEFTVQDLYKIV